LPETQREYLPFAPHFIRGEYHRRSPSSRHI
jgi:hypothetical protein